MINNVYVIDSNHPDLGGQRAFFSEEIALRDTLSRVRDMLRSQRKSLETDETECIAREFLDENLKRFVPAEAGVL